MPTTDLTWKAQAVAAARTLVVAVLTGFIITVALVIGFSGQTAEERLVREQTLNATLATACELALPSDPVTGRDPEAVQLCFTQYGLEPPRIAP